MENQTTMTKAQATEKAYQLRQQGLTFPEITNKLWKEDKYISEKTGKPIKQLTVRNMILSVGKKDPKPRKALKDTRQSLNGASSYKAASRVQPTPTDDLLEAVKKIADIQGVGTTIKVKLIQALIQKD